MSLTITNDEADHLARELAQATGESVAEAVVNALRERLARHRRTTGAQVARLSDELLAIGRKCASLPVLDSRDPDEILGYDANGLPR